MDDILPLQDIPQKTWDDFAKKVKTAKGKLIIFVHPSELPTEQREVMKKIIKQDKTPTLILEHYPLDAKSEEWLKKNLESQGIKHEGYLKRMGINERPLMIATILNAPQIVLRIPKPGMPIRDMSVGGFGELIKHLKKAGVKTIWVGGSMARLSRGYKDSKKIRKYERKRLPKKTTTEGGPYTNEPFTEGCAGTFYETLILSHEFEQVAWVPKATDFVGQKKKGYIFPSHNGSPYPPPHEREGKLKPKRNKLKLKRRL